MKNPMYQRYDLDASTQRFYRLYKDNGVVFNHVQHLNMKKWNVLEIFMILDSELQNGIFLIFAILGEP